MDNMKAMLAIPVFNELYNIKREYIHNIIHETDNKIMKEFMDEEIKEQGGETEKCKTDISATLNLTERRMNMSDRESNEQFIRRILNSKDPEDIATLKFINDEVKKQIADEFKRVNIMSADQIREIIKG